MISVSQLIGNSLTGQAIVPQLLIWTLEGQRYALPLAAVERVVRAVAVTPFPAAPGAVCGIVNVQGQVVAVIDLRRRLQLPARAIALSDQMVLASTARRRLALIADAVNGVAECADEAVVTAGHIIPGAEYMSGVMKLDDGMILIHDLDRFLSLDEELALEKALSDAG